MKLSRLKSLLLEILVWVVTLLSIVPPVLSAPFPPQIALIAQVSIPLSETQNTQPQEPHSTAETATHSSKQTSVKRETPTQAPPARSTAPIEGQEANRTLPSGAYDMEAIKAFDRDIYGAE